MKSGVVFRRFEARDGREVILRTLKWEDLNDLLGLINSLVEEGADITRDRKVTLEEEADWLGRKLANLEKDKEFCLVAEVDGRVVANSELERKGRFSTHVGQVDIAIREGYRDVGIGTEMLGTLINHAADTGFEILTLGVFSTNKRAIHVYEKLGFRETGRVPNEIRKNGKYIDNIIMTKVIQATSPPGPMLRPENSFSTQRGVTL